VVVVLAAFTYITSHLHYITLQSIYVRYITHTHLHAHFHPLHHPRLAVGGPHQWELMHCSYGSLATAATAEQDEDPDKVMLGT
jgi:hypothetical protein